MSIDDLARAAASDAHRRAAHEVDLASSLRQLHRTHRVRNVSWIVGAVAAAAVVLVGGGALISDHRSSSPVAPSAISPTPTDQGVVCKTPRIVCLGNLEFRVGLTVPVTVTLPANFEGAFSLLDKGVLEDYRTDSDKTGVTVFENAVPVKDDDSWSPDLTAGATAKSMAIWLSKRPFLTAAHITPTTVGGRTAWLVSAELRPGVLLPADKDGQAAGPTFKDGRATAGYTKILIGQYTLLDVPHAGVTVIWSWSESDAAHPLVGNQAYVDGLRFG
jgi:hypothetical protein